ncbi:hypothetical protein CONLIGDRAFT_629808 [Coniochaeta ligniaria NRRL 30616]|uniref:F-box domain-containing protein n=1 Tax=Coniochaeta ligniaria NRRL 30616 TaxID=1408157 RepID=A0A1J7IX94_9PEZI|nr:hypothetical protein CONLIGDRAFT_629808 [Coniochaeta ligniaria NRRL 30616]
MIVLNLSSRKLRFKDLVSRYAAMLAETYLRGPPSISILVLLHLQQLHCFTDLYQSPSIAIMKTLRRLVASTKDRCTRLGKKKKKNDSPRKAQNLDCALLQLPVEMIVLISEALSPAEQIIFSQTCWALRTVLGSNPAGTLDRHERLEYLAGIARGLPGQWACAVCETLHSVNSRDTPKEPQHMTCPQQFDPCGFQSRLFDSRHLQLGHRHIQLALKYVRMGDYSRSNYLQELVAPYHDDNFVAHRFTEKWPNVLAARYSVYPKVAVGPDGNLRYLTLSV